MSYREIRVPGVGVLWRVDEPQADPADQPVSAAGLAGAQTPASESAQAQHPDPIAADGCVDFVLRNEVLTVAGPSTRALQVARLPKGAPPTVGIRFLPGTAAAVLGMPLGALRDTAPGAEQLIGSRDARRIAGALRQCNSGAPEHLTAIAPEAILALRARIDAADMHDTVAQTDWRSLVLIGARSELPHTEVARIIGWSPRHLHRRMNDDFGYGYAALRRVFRSERARELLRAGMPPADVTARAGYADQAHLTRELTRTAGVTPAVYAARHPDEPAS